MHPLDYQPAPRGSPSTNAALFVMPVVATVVTFLSTLHYGYQEPFGDFYLTDAAIQLGSPLLVWNLWGYWYLKAVRGRHRIVDLWPVAAWATVTLAYSFLLGVSYVSEPWNG